MKKIVAFLSVLCVCMTLGWTSLKAGEGDVLQILFTHDLHNNIEPFKTVDSQDEVVEMGGYAYLKSIIDKTRSEQSILVDAGDFSMGTLFNGIFESYAPDLNLLGLMGYDAITLGNHEFDYGVDGLIEAIGHAEGMPPLLASNLIFEDTTLGRAFEAGYEKVGQNTLIVDKGGIKVGLFGLMGNGAKHNIDMAGDIAFGDITEVARTSVDILKQAGVDVIVCLSHTGTSSTSSKSEDELLAKEVPGIDVIISGHSHTTLAEPDRKSAV